MHHIVIIGAGFGGLYTAKKLAGKNVQVTLIDKRNFHLFQPLLYQVATGGLSPGDIAAPIRSVFKNKPNINVVCADVKDINPQKKEVNTAYKTYPYDALIIASGVHHSYFGNPHWEGHAPGLKTIEDALHIRQKILSAFEKSEVEQDSTKRKILQRFVIIGAGPTGVEMAGAMAELANQTLLNEFNNIDPSETEIFLIEGAERVLPAFDPTLSAKAERSLKKLGVTILTQTRVKNVDAQKIVYEQKGKQTELLAGTLIWAAGVQAGHIGQIIALKLATKVDRTGRIIVNRYCSFNQFPNVFVIGDLAHFKQENGAILPGVAQVAMQQGDYVARLLLKKLKGKNISPFRYLDKGNMAVIGRKAAVVQMPWLHLSGWPAWLIWIFIHIAYLIEYDSKAKVLLQWAWNFFTRKRGARLITKI